MERRIELSRLLSDRSSFPFHDSDWWDLLVQALHMSFKSVSWIISIELSYEIFVFVCSESATASTLVA